MANQHRGHGRYGVGLEQVGRHTGAVTHVVTNVVGDGGRVAGIVFGNAGFDLTDQVSANVSTLGEDTAAQTGKNRNQAATETEGNQGNHVMGQGVVAGNRGQGQAGHDHTGNGTALEGHGQTGGHAFSSRFRRADIGNHGNPHADVARNEGGHGAHEKTDGGFGTHGHKNNTKNDNTGNPHAFHLAIEIGDRAFLDGACDLLHFFVSSRCAFNNRGQKDGKHNTGYAYQRTCQRQII